MTPQLEIGIEGHAGVIALNRPEAINALSLEMIRVITETLKAWSDDPAVRLVLFEGRGPRGFCAGGDVRAVRELVLAGKSAEAEAFFAAEYAMNGMIVNYRKPVVAISEGVVMGGGIGIAGHAAFRFTTPEARFAMPEGAIGFVCDVGVNQILARAPEARALAFLMSGLPVGGGDALALGLADCTVKPERLGEIRSGVIAAAGAGSIDTALVALMQAESIVPGAAQFCALADQVEAVFAAETAEEIVAGLAAAADPSVEILNAALRSRAPTSLEAILQGHRAARQLQDIDAILALDLRLARYMAGRSDFAEGVRAVLIDKDQRPSWQPAAWADVPRAEIVNVVAAPSVLRHAAD